MAAQSGQIARCAATSARLPSGSSRSTSDHSRSRTRRQTRRARAPAPVSAGPAAPDRSLLQAMSAFRSTTLLLLVQLSIGVAGTLQRHPNLRDGAAQDPRDLRAGKLLEVAQHEHEPVARMEAIEELERCLFFEDALPFALAGGKCLGQRDLGMALPPPRRLTAGIDRDAVEPRQERRLTAEAGEMDEGTDERLLRGVERRLGVAEQAQTEGVDTLAVAAHDLI